MTFVKPAELERLRALPDSKEVRLFVVAGPDEASAEALSAHLLALAGGDCERVALDSAELRDDPARLPSEASALSLFATARIITLRISGEGAEALAAVQALLAAEKVETPVVATAVGLTRKSRLGKLVEADAQTRLVQCYQPTHRDLVRIASNRAAEQGLQLASREAAQLVDMVAGDRALLDREIEKIALYCDATPDKTARVSAEDIAAIGAATYDEDISACVNASLGGEVQRMPEIFNRIEAIGIVEIRLIRALARRAMLLGKLSGEIAKGKTIRAVVSDRRHAIFWKEQDAVAAQLRLWDSTASTRLSQQLLDCESALKRSASLGGVAFRKLITDIARHAARARRRPT